MQFEEQKEQVATEQILRVVFLDVEQPTPVSSQLILTSYSPFVFTNIHRELSISLTVIRFCQALEKLKRQLAEAEAALESRKKPSEDTGPRIIGEGLVIDEWVRALVQNHTFLKTKPSFSPFSIIIITLFLFFISLVLAERTKRTLFSPTAK